MALALGLTVELELSRIACFAAIPQLMLDAVVLKLAPFVDPTDARPQPPAVGRSLVE
jgi:hypothetical protein